MRPRIAIVGAGITGLVAALQLTRHGHSVTVFERWPDVGGQASAFDLGNGVFIDRYYHHLFLSDRVMRELHETLLPGQLEWFPSTVGVYRDGRIWPFVSPRDLLTYRPIPLVDRIRLGLAVLLLTRRTDWTRMDEIGALDWLRRMCGERAVDAVWRPLMLGKFGEHARGVPLAWLWSKLVLRRGRDPRGELLGYPRRSFQAIAHAIATEVSDRGGRILLDTPVVRVDEREGSYGIRCAAPGSYRLPPTRWRHRDDVSAEADAVLFTTPTHVTRELTEWPDALGDALDAWSYRAAAVLLLELRRPFSSTYWTNIADAAVPFLGLIEHTNLVPAERYPARYLYVSNYVDSTDMLMAKTLDEVVGAYLPSLQRISAGFTVSDVQRAWWFREESAQPIPTLGDRHRIISMRTPRRGLFIANTTQIYPEDRGTNYSAKLGMDAAACIERTFV